MQTCEIVPYLLSLNHETKPKGVSLRLTAEDALLAWMRECDPDDQFLGEELHEIERVYSQIVGR